jgi:hypothetical protein
MDTATDSHRGLFKINLRPPTETESTWFQNHPEISGYAADDDSVVINPFTKLSDTQISCVIRNEAFRIFMRILSISPALEITESQENLFKRTPYGKNRQALCQTIIARIASSDPSAGTTTEFQEGYAKALGDVFDKLVEIVGNEESNRAFIGVAVGSESRATDKAGSRNISKN